MATLVGLSATTALMLLKRYGYVGIFALMTLEAASLPIPSEVVLPAIGILASGGILNPFLAFVVAIAGAAIGMAIDYYVAYYLGKAVVYKHLRLFRVKQENLDAFDAWFSRNGDFAVFVTRMLPVVRGLINFPAGFARMDIRKFYAYSIAGTVIWFALLIAFGYYALAITNAYLLIAVFIAFAVAVYLLYWFATRRMRMRA
jgi:membrane protein DedA with SNARE-associated domain